MKGDDITTFEAFFQLLREQGHKVVHPDTGEEWTDIVQIPEHQINIGVRVTTGAMFVFNRNAYIDNPKSRRNLIYDYRLIPLTQAEFMEYKETKKQEYEEIRIGCVDKLVAAWEKDGFGDLFEKIDPIIPSVAGILELPVQDAEKIKNLLHERIKRDFASPVKPSDVTRCIASMQSATKQFLAALTNHLRLDNGQRWIDEYPYANSPQKEAGRLVIEQADDYAAQCGNNPDLYPYPRVDDEGSVDYRGKLIIYRMAGTVEYFADWLAEAHAESKEREMKPKQGARSSGKQPQKHVYDFISSLCGVYESLTESQHFVTGLGGKTNFKSNLIPFISAILDAMECGLSEKTIRDYLEKDDTSLPIMESPTPKY